MNQSKKVIFFILTLTIIGGFLRFVNNTKNPNSLNIDEVAYGYSAYSILKTSRDENGVFLPLSFRSTGDFKNPVLIYSLVPAIAMFGLNEFSVRFTTAFIGTLTIPAFFLMLLSLIKDNKVSFLGTILLTISPWHIYYSRFASDHTVGLFFLILGVYFFQKMLEGRKIWTFFSSIAFILSIYSYHSQRLFVPLFILTSLILNMKKLKPAKDKIIIFTITCFVLILPLAYLSLFGGASSRAGMIFLSQDIDYTRYVIIDHLYRSDEIFLFVFFWIQRYLNYFQPDFLFFNGLNMTMRGTLGVGILYLYEFPWLIAGIIELVKRKIPNKTILVAWILIGILPASLTNNAQNSGRTIIILPALLLIVAFGAMRFYRIIDGIKNRYFKIAVIGGYTFFISIILIQTFLVFAIHFPQERGEAFMEGTKETVLYAIKNQEKYREIVYDPYRGIEAPYIVSIPHMYLLFYSKYDPATFQNIVKNHNTKEALHFDKYTFRPIDWHADKYQNDVLFIGSPWSLPQKDLRQEDILEKVYLDNGNLAFLIVSLKKL